MCRSRSVVRISCTWTGADSGFCQGGPGFRGWKLPEYPSRIMWMEWVICGWGPELLVSPGNSIIFNAEMCILPHPGDTFPIICDIQLNIKNFKKDIVYQSLWDIFMMLYTLKIYIFLSPWKGYTLWLFNLKGYAEQSNARNFYEICAEK